MRSEVRQVSNIIISYKNKAPTTTIKKNALRNTCMTPFMSDPQRLASLLSKKNLHFKYFIKTPTSLDKNNIRNFTFTYNVNET